MAGVSVRNRISAILLSSDEALTTEQILARYPGRNTPTKRTVAMLLSSHAEYVEVGRTRKKYGSRGSGNVYLWTHIDHALLSPKEEE
ncbi:MAG: hypothetical protein CMA57_05055 [Euryarchaeota archaeon]|nr:hypothetical protein [Euryarchaeota archaeon]